MLSIISSLRSVLRQPKLETARSLHTTISMEAARKGTREKARKKKVKVEVTKTGFIPHNQRQKNILVKRINKHVDDSWKQIPKDNVYVAKYYRWPVYTVAEAIQCHRETHHPTMYNVPDAQLEVHIELNMQAEKSVRYVDNFQRIAMIPYKFEHGEERKILVFTKGNDEIVHAREAGAALVGGVELIKDIANGDLSLTDYQFVLAHPNILPELVALRGLMKRKFPNPKSETLGTNLAEMIVRFSNGINYTASKDEHQKDFGLITTTIGTLDMNEMHLEENLKCLLQDVNSMRPKRDGEFIKRVILKSHPSSEQLKIDAFLYVPRFAAKTAPAQKKKQTETKTDNENNENNEQVAVAN